MQQQQVQEQQQQQQPPAALHGAVAATSAAAQALAPAADAEQASEAQPSALWALAMMTLGYLHLSVTLYALPSLVPFIAQDLRLDDTQGALLTTGYTILYGLVLVPMGIIADSTNRPRLLAGGVALWSLLTMAASQSQSFGQLIASRIGFAAAQATCNPVAYSLIPELFPRNRTAAMAVYNTAIYLGRAGAFAVLLAAGQAAGQAAVMDAADPAWRSVLWALGPPGLLLAAVALLTVRESRQQDDAGLFLPLVTLSGGSMDGGDAAATTAAAPAMVSAPASAAPRDLPSALAALGGLLSDRSFLALTGATAFGDVASWALIAWQGLYYERVMGLEPAVYAPLIAGGICIGGIVGGIGSGLFGDRLTSKGKRAWLTAGTSVAAAPLMAASFLLPDYKQSFVALLVGYALSECWRAPAAVMVREVAPAGLGSTAGALNLCVRGLAGALGPVGIAQLSAHVGLQNAMMLIPACHVAAGLSLAATEGVIAEERAKAKAVKSH
ncbi:hypothetical protein ABPG77_004659 [Micractinium sp. CCAP 211/92]